MSDAVRKYANDDITVVWEPAKCIHSTVCWKGLISVFNPRSRPWINISGAETDRIIEQVERCPSGALSFFRNDERDSSTLSTDSETIVEPMKNGSLMVYGSVRVKKRDGSEEVKHKVTAFCRCGASANKPFCDGTHVKIGFRDE